MGCFCKITVDTLLTTQVDAQLQAQLDLQLQAQLDARVEVRASVAAQLAARLQIEATASLRASLPVEAELVAAASRWIAARWLPAPAWQPDPAWLELDLAIPPLPAEALAVIIGLLQAAATCRAVLGIDLTLAAGGRALARLIVTLNLRLEALRVLALDVRPWSELAVLNAQADSVRVAATAGLFTPTALDMEEPEIGPWRSFLAQLKALAPVIAIGRMLNLDFADPSAFAALAAQLRILNSISLPVLADATLVLQLIARASAIEQLTVSLGRSPLGYPIARVTAAVHAKLSATAALLPPSLTLAANGQFLNAPVRPPNPSLLANSVMVQAALRIKGPALRWKVPTFNQLDLLTIGAPAMALAASLGAGMVRATPCGQTCDASRALKQVGL